MLERRRTRALVATLSLSCAVGAWLGVGTAGAAQVQGTSATFTWDAASGPVAGYTVFVSRNGGAYGVEGTAPASPRSATVTGQAGDDVRIRVAAFDAQGSLGPQSARSELVTFLAIEEPPPDDPPDAGPPAPPPAGDPPAGIAPSVVSASFASPVYATAPPGDGRLFVVERAGRIRILDDDGTLRPRPFLDIRSRVGTAGEGGLLGLAFDPDFAMNGVFYVYYTDRSGDSVVARYQLGSDPNEANPLSEEALLTVDQPATNHDGGTLAFSPEDGYLYIGLGDGGDANDPAERAQDGSSLLGKMLRIDVSGGPGVPYAIPPDNPFVGDAGVRDEIWALGLRNPYRFAFDWQTGDLWIGDVGQGAREEIDFEPAGDPGGRNYGWDVMEGTACNTTDPAPAPPCDDPSLTLPVHDYPHTEGNCSVIGGPVYRGPVAEFQGLYFFGDFCSGRIWSLEPGNGQVTERTDEVAPAAGAAFQLTALSEGGFGELYAVHEAGDVFRLGPGGSECSDGIDNDGDGFTDFGPDPGCASASDPSEHDSDLGCDDGFDNDRNGLVDFPQDAACGGPGEAFEGAAVAPEVVADAAGGAGSGCGIGPELVPLLPALAALRRRRGRRTR